MDKIIDARGRSCPEPVIMIKSAVDVNPNNQFTVLVDTNVAVENISRFAKSRKFNVTVDENNEGFEITLRK